MFALQLKERHTCEKGGRCDDRGRRTHWDCAPKSQPPAKRQKPAPAKRATAASEPTDPRFPAGTVVWAKVYDFPYWPATISSVDSVADAGMRKLLRRHLKKRCNRSSLLVQFFETGDKYSWAKTDRIVVFAAGENAPGSQTGCTQEAIEQAEAAVMRAARSNLQAEAAVVQEKDEDEDGMGAGGDDEEEEEDEDEEEEDEGEGKDEDGGEESEEEQDFDQFCVVRKDPQKLHPPQATAKYPLPMRRP